MGTGLRKGGTCKYVNSSNISGSNDQREFKRSHGKLSSSLYIYIEFLINNNNKFLNNK